MKKRYSLIFALFFILVNVNAVTINVTINASSFSPASFSAVIGDEVVWTTTGTHNVTGNSLSVPAGAVVPNSGTMTTSTNTTYSYTISVAGSYGYACTFHSFAGTFTVSATNITEPSTNLLTGAYPNPFNDKVTIKYNGIESIEVFNVVGDKVKMIELSATENKTEIDFSHFPTGIYFYRTYKEGIIVETRKIVKAN